MMRYIRSLERKDIGLDTSMIPLGSCTMKLNAASEMLPVTWPEFSRLHPFAPVEQAEGYQQIFRELEAALCEITGFAAVSLQPNSGAQGEFAGLMVIRAYHHDRGDAARDVVLIPASAHGTNPGQRGHGRHARRRRGQHAGRQHRRRRSRAEGRRAQRPAGRADGHLSVDARRVRGSIQDICAIVHEHGGQVYMDGANMNAQVGLTSPAAIGADVCHLNLHKTFAFRTAAAARAWGRSASRRTWRRTCPAIRWCRPAARGRFTPLSAAPWGSASILLISYGYIKMLGGAGHDRRHPLRDPQRQLHQVAARAALSGALHAARTAASRTR